MSDAPTTPYGQAWLYGAKDTAIAAKAAAEQDHRCLSIYPDRALPPSVVDEDGLDGAFLVSFLLSDPYPTPAGMKRANSSFGMPVLGTL